jgi:predicted nucleic acid-binding protein
LGVTDRVLVDTGPLVAIFSDNDEHHGRCVEAIKAMPSPMLTCWPVVPEAAWLLRKRSQNVYRMLEAFEGSLLSLLPLHGEDLPAIADILKRYEDAALQFADAALVHLAEREKIRTVITLDRRDFSLIRLKRNRALNLIAEVESLATDPESCSCIPQTH